MEFGFPEEGSEVVTGAGITTLITSLVIVEGAFATYRLLSLCRVEPFIHKLIIQIQQLK